MLTSFLHSGCAGDCLYSLPTVMAILNGGEGEMFLTDSPWTKPLMCRFDTIATILNAQPNLKCSRYDGRKIDHDLSTFRNGGQKFGETIVNRHARWMRTKVDISKPWLVADADPRTVGKIVVARSPRWQGFQFPWRELVKTFGQEMVFVGVGDEYQIFCREFGTIPHLPTPTLLDVARAIQGAELFIGNQSSPNAVAEGLHKNSVVEICSYACDCFYHRPNVIHSLDGALDFTCLGKRFQWPGFARDYGYEVEVAGKKIRSAVAIHCEIMAGAEYIRIGQTAPEKIKAQPFQKELAYA